MPEYDPTIQDKLDDLQALTGADRKPAEIVAIYWPSPTGTKVYASAMYTELPWWPDLAAAIETYFGDPIPITLTLIPDRSPFIDLPRVASVSDDSINLAFSDLDDEFSGLLMDYGEGIRAEVFGYWPAVDLLLSLWRGMLHQPKEMDRERVKITATAGWRAPQMLVPKRPHATSCPFIFGALLSSQEEIDYHNGCPYNVHIGGSIGVPGFTDCPRRVKADCVERLDTEVFWPGFETRPDAIPNNQTKGPNLLAKAIGNESNLSDPIRAIAGERYVKALNLLAFRIEEDTNHPEDGFGAALFEVAEGPLLAMWEFRINGQIVGAEHQQMRLGELGQSATDWSPEVNSYSGTAVVWGRIQGDFRNAQASDFSGSVRALGSHDVRVYSDPDTFTQAHTKNRARWLLKVLAEARWGYGQDYPRFNIQSFIDAAAWCDELVTLTDANGNTFSGVRSTFNAEVTARAIQQQVKDICTAGRLGIPFEFEGKDVVVPLRAEDVDDPNIPTFTDEGASRNVIYDGTISSLSWSVISDDDMTNQWTVNFDDASNGGVDTQFIFGDQPQQLRAGRAWGDRSKRVINKNQAGYGITSAQETARFGNSLLYLGPLDSGGILNPFSVKFTTWYSEAFNVQNYKLIKVINSKLQSRMTAYFTARGLEPYPGADFTCFRVTKYTRKGDLRVEIEAQQYATLDESEFVCECDADEIQAGDQSVTWGSDPDIEAQDDNSLKLTSALGAHTFSDELFDGATCTTVTFPLLSAAQEGSWSVTIEDATGDSRYGWFFNMFGPSLIYRPIVDGVTDPDNVFASHGDVDWEAAGGLWTHRIFYDGEGGVFLQFSFSGSAGTFSTFYSYSGLPTDKVYRVRAEITTLNKEVPPVSLGTHSCTGPVAGTGGFSYPRDFTATVNATTGQVQYTWSPPAIGPHLVTGYEMYEEDGTTVVMPAALTYNFTETLTPGSYTRLLRATDGVNFSSYVPVTFTVPAAPPDTLTLIDRITGNTLVDRLTGEILESRTA